MAGPTAPDATPAYPIIGTAEFARLIAALGPFEAAPHLAVAVSGGADSLCLAALANDWARARGGRTTGLIVDHGLRPESADEAVGVGEQLTSIGIATHILAWDGEKPDHGVPAAARAARYRLLFAWCREHGILHLLIGHHAADQAETIVMREHAKSGADGLAGMAAIVEHTGLRILRPFLGVAPARLRTTLRAAGLTWVEDPTNRDRRYTRTRVRHEIAETGRVEDLASAAHVGARSRIARERHTACDLVRDVRLFPSGHAVVGADTIANAAPTDAHRCLSALIRCIAATAYAPRTKRLEALRTAIAGATLAGGRTLGGCRFLPWQGDDVLICREAEAYGQSLTVLPGNAALWDGRFVVRVNAAADAEYRVRRLDDDAWAVLRRRDRDAAAALTARLGGGMAAVRAGLPALYDLDAPLALPHLPRWQSINDHTDARFSAHFAPRMPVSGSIFGTAVPAEVAFDRVSEDRV